MSQTRNEKKVSNKIRKRLVDEFPGIYIKKISGGPMQARGITDFIACVEGTFFGIEVKDPNNPHPEGTPGQQKAIEEITEAGGVAGIVTSPDEAYHLVRKALKKKRMR